MKNPYGKTVQPEQAYSVHQDEAGEWTFFVLKHYQLEEKLLHVLLYQVGPRRTQQRAKASLIAPPYNHPFNSASRAASIRLCTPSF